MQKPFDPEVGFVYDLSADHGIGEVSRAHAEIFASRRGLAISGRIVNAYAP